MKRWGIRAVCMLLLSVLALGCGLAEDSDYAKNPLAIDMVIAIQNDLTIRDKYDGDGLRFDAAASLISMCDVNFSRAQYFMFANKLYQFDKAAKVGNKREVTVNPGNSKLDQLTLLDISLKRGNTDKRKNLIEALTHRDIYNEYTVIRNEKLNIGAAFEAAVAIQKNSIDHKENNNRKVILLLTAGVDQGGTDSRDRALKAKQVAEENGIEVYAIALGTTTSATLLKEIAGDNYAMVDSAGSLMAEYRTFFADMIGSEPRKAAVKTDGDQMSVSIQIPNDSVKEVNIILPLETIENPVLTKPDGSTNKQAASDKVVFTEDVMIAQGRNFINYKLLPAEPGEYRLTYVPDKNAAKNIDIQYVFSYDLSLNAVLRADSGREASQFHKSDILTLETYFVTDEGKKSADAALYEDQSGGNPENEWMTVKAFWEIYQVDEEGKARGKALKSGELNANPGERMFESAIDLKEGGLLPQGSYLMVVNAKGAGMDRHVELPIQILNHEPKAPEALEYTIRVNLTSGDPGKTSWKKVSNEPLVKNASGDPVSLKDLFTDPDGDDMSFRLEGDKNQIAAIVRDLGDVLRYSTTEAGGKVVAGQAEYTLFYRDADPATEEQSIPVTLKVRSIVDEELEAYKPEMTLTGDQKIDVSPAFRKNSTVTIALKLKNNDGSGYAKGEALKKYLEESTLQILDSTGTNTVENGHFTLTEEEDAFVYVIEDTGNKEARWDVTATIGLFEPATAVVSIPNKEAPAPAAAEEITVHVKGDKVPGFLLPLIGGNTEEQEAERTLTPAKLFTDSDGDILVYEAPKFLTGTDGAEPVAYLSITPSPAADGMLDGGKVYTIQVDADAVPGAAFSYSFTNRMTLTAKDGDSKTGTLTQVITVVDLYNKMITYLLILLAAIVALTILILIIHQIFKPVMPQLNLTIREEPSLYDSASGTLSPVKTSTNVNAMGVDADMAAKHSLSLEMLQNIIIKPIRSRLSVGVMVKKMVGGHEVTINDVRLKTKKLYTWSVGQDLSIRNINGEGFVTIKLEDRMNEEPVDVTDNFGGDDGWSDFSGSQNSTGGTGRSRKVSRKASPAEEPKENNNSSDGFDW